MRMRAVLLAIMVMGCETGRQPGYAQQIAQIPIPQDEFERTRLCGYLRSEIARMNSAPMHMATPSMAPMYRIMIAQNIAALEQKASETQCGAAFGQAPSPVRDCFNLCKSSTNRTDSDCFDSCK